MKKVVLYKLEEPNLKVDVEAYFNANGQLVIDGYDRGKRVKALRGTSSYEYLYAVEAENVKAIAQLLGNEAANSEELLQLIQERFHGNHAFSEFGRFLRANDIDYSFWAD